MQVTHYPNRPPTIEYFEDAPGRPVADQLAAASRNAIVGGATKLVQQSVEPYGPCPCGSGNKFKFCCRAKIGQGPQPLSPTSNSSR